MPRIVEGNLHSKAYTECFVTILLQKMKVSKVTCDTLYPQNFVPTMQPYYAHGVLCLRIACSNQAENRVWKRKHHKQRVKFPQNNMTQFKMIFW